jgi:prepilin-type processing-associated H-X9-DG protein
VEVLAVTAIVGMLAGLLLPALSRAKETSRAIVCTGNLRQIGQATAIYHDDYGVLPTANIAGYFLWNGGQYLLYGRLLANRDKSLAKAFYCPSAATFAINDPDTGIQNLGVLGKMAVGDYYVRSTLDGAPTVLGGEAKALLADLYFAGDSVRNHAGGVNVLYTDGAVAFAPVPATWDLTQANAWDRLDRR